MVLFFSFFFFFKQKTAYEMLRSLVGSEMCIRDSRIGRTGRAGKSGKAITFYTEDDKERLPMVVKLMQESGSPVDDWMLKLKTNKSAEKRLGKATPHRNMISNAKKQAIREKYLEKQYKRMRGGEEAKTNGKGRRTDEHGDDNNNDDNGLGDLL
eukprot:TRINITY_DN22955_c0_g1_i4.p1 TRINITY_DN22955_c0_g1~~TRINITY_DN22955_c0_g1_i4.p1  ORF type:complete len:154 (+),score=67.52 TRINITY_DN22955_c0_g1_i4:80-541(+)